MELTTENVGKRHSLKEFEKDLLEYGTLRLKPFFKRTIKGMTLENFIKNFFKEYNNSLGTFFAEDKGFKRDTAHTKIGARRSGGDVFLICKYYYPKCTLEEVMKIIDTLQVKGLGDGKYLKSQVCKQIKKRVYNAEDRTTVYHPEKKDEFNRLVGEYIINK